MALDQSGLRDRIFELYGLDIDEAERHFSTHNYAYIFPGAPFMVRVNVGATKSREEALSEVLWLDDLKAFSETVCEPAPSLAGNLVEECEVDGQVYRISMFRTAKGAVKDPLIMEPLDVICVGDLLGRIHQAGQDAISHGITYRFHSFEEGVSRHIELCEPYVSPEVHARMEAIHAEVLALPREPGTYGLLHGDFHSSNFFMDGHNVWVFDFDNVVYGHYMYDVAECVYETWLLGGYEWPKGRREVLAEDVMPYFRQGYEFHHHLPETTWAWLPLFLREHVILPVANLCRMPSDLMTPKLRSFLDDFTEILLAPDIFAATDAVLRARHGGEGTIEIASARSEVAVSEAESALDDAPEGARAVAVDVEREPVESEHYALVYEEPISEGRAILRPRARLDTNNAEEVSADLLDLAQSGAIATLTIDGTDLEYLSSAGIRTFVRLLKALGSLRLENLQEGVHEVLDVSGILDLPGIEVT